MINIEALLIGLAVIALIGYAIPALILPGYLWRWHLIPRNKLFNIYLHVFVGDDDATFHDHPFNSWSLCLWGRMREYRQVGIRDRFTGAHKHTATESSDVGPGTFAHRGLGVRHYIKLRSKFAVTIFCTGPLVNYGTWFFYPHNREPVPFWNWPQSFTPYRWSWAHLRHIAQVPKS